MFVDMFYTSFFGMPNPDPVMRRNMICSNPGAFNAFKMQSLMDMSTFKSFLISKYSKQEIWNALPTPMDLIGNLFSYPNMALRLMSSSQYYVIMQTFNSMTNMEFLTCFYEFRPQNYFSYVYSLGQLGSIFAKGYPIMTFMSDFARNNPSQIEALWNAMLGTYGQYYSSFQLSELDLYGAKRLGVIADTLKLNTFYFNGSYNAASNSYNISSTYSPQNTAQPNLYLTSFTYGKKQYEITNHLGNVLSTVSDYKLPYLNSTGKLCYNPDIRSENKYYAFGGAKDGNYLANVNNNYRYSFNGKPDDAGTGLQDYGMRMYDDEIGRFISVDPIARLYPQLSVFQFASLHPINSKDIDGLEADAKFDGIERNDERAAQRAHPNDANAQQSFIIERQKARAVGALIGVAVVSGAEVGYTALINIGIALGANPNLATNIMGLVAGTLDQNPGADYPGGLDDIARATGLVFKGTHGAIWKTVNQLLRGFEYEKLAGGNLVSNYPVIDYFLNGVGKSIKTMDLKTKSYVKTYQVFNKLKGYIDDLAEFKGTIWAKVDTRYGAIKEKVLQIAIPENYTKEQCEGLIKAIKYGQEKGVEVRIFIEKEKKIK